MSYDKFPLILSKLQVSHSTLDSTLVHNFNNNEVKDVVMLFLTDFLYFCEIRHPEKCGKEMPPFASIH